MKLDDLLDRLEGVQQRGSGYIAQCPARKRREADPEFVEKKQAAQRRWRERVAA